MKPTYFPTKTKHYALSALAALGLIANCGSASASVSAKPTVVPFQLTSQQFTSNNKLAACLLKIDSIVVNDKNNKDKSEYFLESIVAVSNGQALISASLSRISDDKKAAQNTQGIKLTKVYLADSNGHNNLSELEKTAPTNNNYQIVSSFTLGKETAGLLMQSFKEKQLLLNIQIAGEKNSIAVPTNLVMKFNKETGKVEVTSESVKFLSCMNELYKSTETAAKK